MRNLDVIVIGNMAPLTARELKYDRQGKTQSMGNANFNKGIFRTIKRLKLLGSWLRERFKNFYSVLEKCGDIMPSLGRDFNYILHCLLCGSRAMAFQTNDKN